MFLQYNKVNDNGIANLLERGKDMQYWIDLIKVVAPIIITNVIFILLLIFKSDIQYFLRNRSIKVKKGNMEIDLKDSNTKEIEKAISATSATNVSPQDEIINMEKKIENTNDNEIEASYFVSLMDAYFKRDTDLMTKAYEKMEKNETDQNKKICNKSFYMRLKFGRGDSKALDELQELEKKYVNSEIHKDILNDLAFCYKKSNEFEKASLLFDKAAEKCLDNEERATNVTLSAICIFEMKDHIKAYEKIISAISDEDDYKALYIYYKELASLYKQTKQDDLYSFALEKAVEYKLNDTGLLFELALSYKELNQDLSLLYYKKLLDILPDTAGALNNIAIVYDKFQIKHQAIKSYKQSADKGNTLASANLAYLYIDAGLFDEAYSLLCDAKNIDDFHPNVGKAIGYLEDVKEKEKSKEEQIITNVIFKQRFNREFASEYFKPLNPSCSISGIWKFEDGCEMELMQKENITEALWNENSIGKKLEILFRNNAGLCRFFSKSYDFSIRDYKYKQEGRGFIYSSGNSLNVLIYLDNDNNKTGKIYKLLRNEQ